MRRAATAQYGMLLGVLILYYLTIDYICRMTEGSAFGLICDLKTYWNVVGISPKSPEILQTYLVLRKSVQLRFHITASWNLTIATFATLIKLLLLIYLYSKQFGI